MQEAIHELEMLFPPSKDENNGPMSLSGPGMDKNKEDRAYFGYSGVSPRDGEDDDEGAGGGSKKNKEKKKKKTVNALTSGLRKQVSEMPPQNASKQVNHNGFKHHSVSSDNMVLGLKGDSKGKGKSEATQNGKKKGAGKKGNANK